MMTEKDVSSFNRTFAVHMSRRRFSSRSFNEDILDKSKLLMEVTLKSAGIGSSSGSDSSRSLL
jgi:hypothetical protein